MENLKNLNISNTEEIVDRQVHNINTEKLDKEVSNRLFKNTEDEASIVDYNSEDDQTPVVNFDNELHYIKEVKAVDIVFIVDCTASMKPMLKGVKQYIRKLVWDANKCLTQYLVDDPEPLQVGLVKYRDHPPQNKSFVTENFQMTSDFSQFKKEVMKMSAEGGGDEAEAVLDGLQVAVSDMNWRSDSCKFIYHFLDAPPHGKKFTDLKDGFPDGCPCNIDYEGLLAEMRGLNIEYNLISLSKEMEKMISLFSNVIKFDVIYPTIEIDKSKIIEQTD